MLAVDCVVLCPRFTQLLFAIFGLLGLKDLCMSGEIGTPSGVSRVCKCFKNFKCVPSLKDLRQQPYKRCVESS